MIRTGLYRYEMAEFQEGMWLTVRTPLAKRFRSLAILGTASLVAAVMLAFLDRQARFMAIAAGAFGLVALAFALFRRQVTYLLAARLIRNQKSKVYRGEHSAEFGDEGFVGQSWPGGKSEVPWSAVRGWSRGALVTVLHVGEMGGVIVPGRSLQKEEDVSKLHDLLTSKVGEPLT